MAEKDEVLQREFFQNFHASAVKGHSGIHTTHQRLTSLVYWKGLTTDVKG